MLIFLFGLIVGLNAGVLLMAVMVASSHGHGGKDINEALRASRIA